MESENKQSAAKRLLRRLVRCWKHRRVIRANSYGAVVLERCGDTQLVLLVGARRGWSFPKGQQEPGESGPETALREVREETGLRIELTSRRGWTVESAVKAEKRSITFYPARCPGGALPVRAADEVLTAGWYPADKALGMIGFEPDREVLRAALAAADDS